MADGIELPEAVLAPEEGNEDGVKVAAMANNTGIHMVAVDNDPADDNGEAKAFPITAVAIAIIVIVVVAIAVAVAVAAVLNAQPTTTTTTRVRFKPQRQLGLQLAIKRCLHESTVGDICLEPNEPIGTWDVSLVTKMPGMFKDAKEFNADISSWEVAEVTDMSSMFEGAKAFNQDIEKWDVSKVRPNLTLTVNPETVNRNPKP